jgi:hypothetical protein
MTTEVVGEIKGLKQVIRSMERLGVSVSDMKGAFTKIGNRGVSTAKQIAPHRSGALAGTIRQSKAKNKVLLRAGYESKRLPYAGVIHYGWPRRNIAPQPFLTDTVGLLADWAVHTLEDELNTLIRREGF